MKKYIAKFEVEIEIEARNEKDVNSLLQDIKFYKDSFGTKGEVRTIRSDLKSFYIANWSQNNREYINKVVLCVLFGKERCDWIK